jgi:hypothetical protein
MKMKNIFLSLMLICITTVAIGSSPSSPLEVALSQPESRQEAESGVVVFTMTNRGNTPIYVLSLQTPFNSNNAGTLLNNVFDVRDGSGKEARYTGMFVSVVMDKSLYIKMNPGETMSKKIDLSKNYDLSSGPFEVSLRGVVLGDISTDLNDAKQTPKSESTQPVISNTLDIWINSAFLIQPQKTSKQDLVPPKMEVLDENQYRMCGEQTLFISVAFAHAKSLATETWLHTIDLEYYDDNRRLKLEEDFRRNNWFGDYDDEWLTTLDALDTENFYPTKIVRAIADRLNDLKNPIQFDCSCPEEGFANEAQRAQAAAYMIGPQKIGICPKFFELDSNGFDTRAGALVHETAHMSDDYAEGVIDQPDGYGTGRAAALAKKDKSAAKRNADNYKYYFESGDL